MMRMLGYDNVRINRESSVSAVATDPIVDILSKALIYYDFSTGTVTDQTTNGNDGLNVGVTLSGGKATFDGSNHYISTQKTAAELGLGNDVTLEFVLNPNAVQNDYTDLFDGSYTSGFGVQQDGGNDNKFVLNYTDEDGWHGGEKQTQLTNSVNQHFVISKRADKITHYVNGETKGYFTVPTKSTTYTALDFYLGCSPSFDTRGYTGTMDLFRLYDDGLTSIEVSRLFNEITL